MLQLDPEIVNLDLPSLHFALLVLNLPNQGKVFECELGMSPDGHSQLPVHMAHLPLECKNPLSEFIRPPLRLAQRMLKASGLPESIDIIRFEPSKFHLQPEFFLFTYCTLPLSF